MPGDEVNVSKNVWRNRIFAKAICKDPNLSIIPSICFRISWALLNDLAWMKFSKHQGFENLLFFHELYTASNVIWSPSAWWNFAFFWSARACFSWQKSSEKTTSSSEWRYSNMSVYRQNTIDINKHSRTGFITKLLKKCLIDRGATEVM